MMCGNLVRFAVVALCFVIFTVHLSGKPRADDEPLSARANSPGIDPDFIVVGIGGFDVNDNETAGQFEVQARFQKRIWLFKPQVGAFVTTKSGFYLYAGGSMDLFFGRRYVASPGFAIGTYGKGDGKKLGGILEFRSSFEIAYRLNNRGRVGIQIGHLSNASLYDENPGAEFAILNYSMPTDVFSR